MVKQGLNDDHFMAVAEHLQSTLEELNVPAELIAEVMTIAASTHDDVLNKPVNPQKRNNSYGTR